MKREEVEAVQEKPFESEQVGTTVSPLKVQMIDFKELMGMGKMQLRFIQPGVLLNGVFEKSQKEIEVTDLVASSGLPLLRKYNSSLL